MMEERLHIRTLPGQKELLSRAAKARHLNLSQFVLQASLEAAQQVVREEEAIPLIKVSHAEFNWLMEVIEQPVQDLPALRQLLNEPTIWNG